MTKARTIADLGTGFVNISDTGTEGTKVATGTTAQRGSTQGQIRFNTTTSVAEYYDGSEFKPIETPPSISSCNVSIIDSNSGGTTSVVITGSFFVSGATVLFVANSGSNVTPNSVTFNSSTQLTAVVTDSNFVNANEPYDIQVTNPSGNVATLADQINVDTTVAFTTSAGSLGTVAYNATGNHFTIGATDQDGDTITFSVISGSLPPGLSLNSATGVISGDPTDPAQPTTSNFTVRASTSQASADRAFSILVTAPPVSISGFLVLAGGGSGGFGQYHSGGGGAGGYRSSWNNENSGRGSSAESSFSAPAGDTLTITVGAGGAMVTQSDTPPNQGNNSSITGTNITDIISLGGGAAGAYSNAQRTAAIPTGNVAPSGGCGGGGNSSGSVVTQGGAGTTGQGYDGGNGYIPASHGAGGGGGTGGNGQNGASNKGGNGGSGTDSTITGSTVTRGGGGGGAGYQSASAGSGGSGGGGAGSLGQATSGTANTGGGGGGAERNGNSYSGAGGSGVVVLRLPTADYSSQVTGSPTVTTSGSDTIITFNASGSYTV